MYVRMYAAAKVLGLLTIVSSIYLLINPLDTVGFLNFMYKVLAPSINNPHIKLINIWRVLYTCSLRVQSHTILLCENCSSEHIICSTAEIDTRSYMYTYTCIIHGEQNRSIDY